MADDLLLSVIASSAFPLVYETVPLQGDMWTDGGIVSNQPIRPAIRMGAEVLFLVLVQPSVQRHGEVKTFTEDGKLKQTVRYQEGKPVQAASPTPAKVKR